MFGFSGDFVNSLNENELAELKVANDTVNKFAEKFAAFSGEPTQDDMKAHLEQVAADQRREMADCKRVQDRFK